jgi:hypothetical protein
VATMAARHTPRDGNYKHESIRPSERLVINRLPTWEKAASLLASFYDCHRPSKTLISHNAPTLPPPLPEDSPIVSDLSAVHLRPRDLLAPSRMTAYAVKQLVHILCENTMRAASWDYCTHVKDFNREIRYDPIKPHAETKSMQHRAVYFNTEGMHITSMPLNKALVRQLKDNTLQYPFIFDKHTTPCTCILPVIRNNWPHLYPGLICKHP